MTDVSQPEAPQHDVVEIHRHLFPDRVDDLHSASPLTGADRGLQVGLQSADPEQRICPGL
jgi:hypothetical protein